MIIEIPARIAFLKRVHIFHGLSDEQLETVAEQLEEQSFPPETDVVQQGEWGNSFYLIYAGRVDVVLPGRERTLGALVPGDYFGEEAVLYHVRRSATVTTREDTLVLALSRDQFQSVIRHVPKLRPNFEVTVASHRLARQRNYTWLEPDEVIYFLARKHPVLLYQALIAPVALLVLASLIKAGFPTLAPVVLVLALLVLLGVAGWAVWRAIDWSNDYYIVTSQRVIWLEKVIGLYDSRQEAPLNSVLSVGVQTDQMGRLLDYGDVIIRTFVGKIAFHHVAHPNQAAALIEEHWGRAKASSHKSDMEQMQRAIRQRLGMQVEQPAPETRSPEDLIAQSPYKPSLLSQMFPSFFKVRFERAGTITYRKHWFVLVSQIWLPSLIFLVGLGAVIWRSVDLFRQPSLPAGFDTFNVIVVLLLVVIGLWWLYQYIDWSNDIYQVTEDQIFDIDKTPLGREERKSAPLDNILATESERRGFLKVLLNYGNVQITVGGMQMVFEDVFDPPSVQQDIDRRREARIQRKKRSEANAERERVADWFATYHRSVEELHAMQAPPPPRPDGNEDDEAESEDKVQ